MPLQSSKSLICYYKTQSPLHATTFHKPCPFLLLYVKKMVLPLHSNRQRTEEAEAWPMALDSGGTGEWGGQNAGVKAKMGRCNLGKAMGAQQRC